MPRNYTKMEQLAEAVFARKAAGETNREIAESYGLTLKQIKQLVARQNRKHEESLRVTYLARKDVRGKRKQAKISNAATKSLNSGCRWSCCKIFCQSLEGGEVEIPGDRTVSW